MIIVVHTTAKSFGEAVILQYVGQTHSWAGEDTLRQCGNWILGDGIFGYHENISHSENGDVGSAITSDSVPDFNLEQTQVVAVRSINLDSYNTNSSEIAEKWELHILFKNSEFAVDPVIAEIIDKFDLN